MPAPVSTTIASASRTQPAIVSRSAMPGNARRRAHGSRARGRRRGSGPRRVGEPPRGLRARRRAMALVRPARAASWQIAGWKPVAASTRSAWSGSSPCSSSVNAIWRARRLRRGDGAARRAAPRAQSACSRLQRGRQPAHVARVDRRQVAAHGHRVAPVVAGEVELRQAVERAHDRRAVAVALPEPERLRRVGDGELDAAGVLVELAGEMAEQQHRGGSEGREPEGLDVGGAGIVAERVEQRVGPGLDRERRGHAPSSTS